MCLSKPHIPEPTPPPIILPDSQKNVELNKGASQNQLKSAGRVGTRALQIPMGNGKKKTGGLRIPQ